MGCFTQHIYDWYKKNKRALPWRETNDPYKIWVSEVILQQTRIAQGTNYYLRFIERFPTVKALAYAHEDEVLKLWQGLGYYSRARNLHTTAKIITEEYHGVFPTTHAAIIQLKGIGHYTAAAIASIAFNLPYPTVDGNVYRVFSRYFGIKTPIDSTPGKKEFQKLAEKLIFRKNPGMHNQALMEFGALQCTPKSPNCIDCPVANSCFAYNKGAIGTFPIKEKKTKQRNRYFYFYLIEHKQTIYLNKRTSNDIWKNLYELPLIETKKELRDKELIQKGVPFLNSNKFNIKSISEKKKHVLSHQIIYARLIHIETTEIVNINIPLIQVNKKDISKFAVPRLLEQFFEDLKLVDKKTDQ